MNLSYRYTRKYDPLGMISRTQVIRLGNQLNRMNDANAGHLGDVPAARFRIAYGQRCATLMDATEQRFAHFFSNLTLLNFVTIRPSNPAAVGVHFYCPQVRDQIED